MHDTLKKVRFSIKPTKLNGGNEVELARTLSVHPLTIKNYLMNQNIRNTQEDLLQKNFQMLLLRRCIGKQEKKLF